MSFHNLIYWNCAVKKTKVNCPKKLSFRKSKDYFLNVSLFTHIYAQCIKMFYCKQILQIIAK